MEQKTCYVCKKSQSLDCFGVDRQKRDGVALRCRSCNTELAKSWALKNKEKRQEICRRYRDKHPERCKDAVKRSQEKNQARIKTWVCANKEKIADYKKRWRKRNPSWCASQRAKRRGANGKFTERQISELFKKQQHKCAICRCSIKKTFHRDHIEPIALGGKNTIDNIQLLCPPCNRAKADKDPLRFMQSQGYLL